MVVSDTQISIDSVQIVHSGGLMAHSSEQIDIGQLVMLNVA